MSGRDPTLREAAGVAVRAMEAILARHDSWDVGPGLEAWAGLANACFVLRRALARDDEAHALAVLKARAIEGPQPVGEAAGED